MCLQQQPYICNLTRRHYVRDDGMVWYRSTELATTARMLTVLALYRSYTEGEDDPFVLGHFAKAKAIADWLNGRRTASLQFNRTDPRYGIPVGDYGGNDPVNPPAQPYVNQDRRPEHRYASAAELYRAFAEIGAVWVAIGKAVGRSDVAAHGNELLAIAPELYADLHASMNRTVTSTPSGARCWAAVADAPQVKAGSGANVNSTAAASGGVSGAEIGSPRDYAAMLYSGALSEVQTAEVYTAAAGGAPGCGSGRYLTLGSPGPVSNPAAERAHDHAGLGSGAASNSIAPPTGYGFGAALLQHDEVERFLLHFFAVSAHGYTRGTWTTPESSDLADRDRAPVAYSAAGEVATPTYLKWMLVFEDLETKTLWLGKAVPRDWLAPGEAPLVAQHVTTRYGRIGFSFEARGVSNSAMTKPVRVYPATLVAESGSDHRGPAGYSVKINVTVPARLAKAPPAGGLRVRVRAPLEHAGKLSGVMVGGKAWKKFDPAEETVDFAASDLTTSMIANGLPDIVATFVSKAANNIIQN